MEVSLSLVFKYMPSLPGEQTKLMPHVTPYRSGAGILQSSDIFAGISIVVTVEPCIMCSAGLHDLKVKEIIYGWANDRFDGKTVVDVPKVVGYSLSITGSLQADYAMDLLRDFYKREIPSAPVAKTKR